MSQIKNVLKVFTSLTVASLLIVACAPQQQSSTSSASPDASTSGIIGGSIVSQLDSISKSTVAITIYEPKENNQMEISGCTGSLLTQNIVLTAAHCIPERGVILIAFARDSKQVTSLTDPKARIVRRVEVHPEAFQNAMKNLDKNFHDLALLKFEGTVPAGYQTVKLLPQSRSLTTGMAVTLAGYGYTNGVKQTTDEVLRKTTVQIANASFSETETLMDETKGHASCHGDSGGPAFVAINGVQMQFGVLSRGYNDPTDTCRGNSVYTNINAHLDWINASIEKLNSAVVAPVAATTPAASKPTAVAPVAIN